MGLFDKLKGELVDIVEWLDDSRDTLVHRFERHQNEIKYGAKLTVREGQTAVFVNEGKIADVFKPGMYTLETRNLPVISTLKGWKHGFNSPFKAEVYFINTRPFPNMKWGTPSPWLYNDPEMGPVKVRAHGSYEIRVGDPAQFLRHLIGTSGYVDTETIADTLRGELISEIGDAVGETRMPVGDMLANFKELGAKVLELVKGRLVSTYGLEILKIQFGSVDLPPEYDAILRKRAEMKSFGVNYMQLQTGAAMESAASNPGGMAGLGAGMGAGMGIGQAMGQVMAGGMGQQPAAQGHGAPPPIPQAESFFVAVNGQQQGPFDLATLGNMARGGQLSRESLVWKQGMSGWMAASQVPQLAGLFAGMPPPLPG